MDTRTTTFSNSNDISQNSSICNVNANNAETLSSSSEQPSASELQSLRRPSENLDSIFESHNFDSYANAKIAVSDGRKGAVHRYILSARSSFFKNMFSSNSSSIAKKLKYELKELGRELDVGFDAVVSVVGYMYGGKVMSLPKGVCVCVDDDDCSHVACRPAVDFMVEVLYASYVFEISEFVALYHV